MIVYIAYRDPKDPPQKTLLTDNFSKVSGYKINTQRSVFFYAPIMNMLIN